MRRLLILACCFIPVYLLAQTTQWRGPNRDGIFPESGLLKEWPEKGPTLLLEVNNIGKGWSSPVVYNNQIFVTGTIDSLDVLSCISHEGNLLWQLPYGRAWDQTFAESRSTPTIRNNRAYLSTGKGEVVCIDVANGKLLWSNNAFSNNEGEVGTWGIAESILLVGNKAIFTTGGKKTAMVALDTETGQQVWQTRTLNDGLAYVSPIFVEQNGKQQIINLTAKFLFGVDPNNGEMIWHFNFFDLDDSEWDNAGGVINCTSPIYHNGFLYVSSGYNHTGAKFKLNDDLSGVQFLWKDKLLDNHHGGVVLYDGVIYGSNWENNSRGKWCAISFDTGEKFFEEPFRNKGSIVAADGMLYLYSEQPGWVALVKPGKEKLEVVSSFQITKGSGAHWAHPFIYDGKLYIRHGEVLMVFDVRKN